MPKWNKPYPLLSGLERFTNNGEETELNLLDFWRFQYSNVWDLQDEMAEFIVSKALGMEVPFNKNGWTLYDIDYNDYRIEVKETSDWHSWNKNGYVQKTPRFDIGKAHSVYKDVESDYERQNDIYVFCHLKGSDAKSANPMNLSAWDFYVVPTKLINERCGDSKTISLSRVKGFTSPVSYNELQNKVDDVIKETYDKTCGVVSCPEDLHFEYWSPSIIFRGKLSDIYNRSLKELGYNIGLNDCSIEYPYDYFKGQIKTIQDEDFKYSSEFCKKEYLRFFELGLTFGATKRHLEKRQIELPEDNPNALLEKYKEFSTYFIEKFLKLNKEEYCILAENLYERCFFRVSAKDILNEYPSDFCPHYAPQEQFEDEMFEIFEIGYKLAYYSNRE